MGDVLGEVRGDVDPPGATDQLQHGVPGGEGGRAELLMARRPWSLQPALDEGQGSSGPLFGSEVGQQLPRERVEDPDHSA
ncbi:MAG: hypothetical protein AB7N76_12435 [Planctomycetota bacterium]